MALINTFSTSSSLRSLYLSFTTFTHSTVLVTPTEFLMVSYLDHPEGPSCSRNFIERSSFLKLPFFSKLKYLMKILPLPVHSPPSRNNRENSSSPSSASAPVVHIVHTAASPSCRDTSANVVNHTSPLDFCRFGFTNLADKSPSPLSSSLNPLPLLLLLFMSSSTIILCICCFNFKYRIRMISSSALSGNFLGRRTRLTLEYPSAFCSSTTMNSPSSAHPNLGLLGLR